ncbi:MAG: hypothetical protein GXX93_09655 [Anaerolineae bacterium]|nr:hypothetical protein [Anaerolineae bacterium]
MDLRAALEALAERFGVRLVHVDTGGSLGGALLNAGLVDEISLVVSPHLVGGETAPTRFRAVSDGPRALELEHAESLDSGEVWSQYRLLPAQ